MSKRTGARGPRPRWKRVARWVGISAVFVVLLAVAAFAVLGFLVRQALTPIIVEHDRATATTEQIESVERIVARAIGAPLPASARAMKWSATTGPLQADEEFVVLLEIDEEAWREVTAPASSLEHFESPPRLGPSDLAWANHSASEQAATQECWLRDDELLLQGWLIGQPDSRILAIWFTDNFDMIPELGEWFEGGVQRRMK